MSDFYIKDLAFISLKTMMLLATPLLMSALIVGVMVSVFQAVTQINEQTLTFIPKMMVVFGLLAIMSPWMADQLVEFTKSLFLAIPDYLNKV